MSKLTSMFAGAALLAAHAQGPVIDQAKAQGIEVGEQCPCLCSNLAQNRIYQAGEMQGIPVSLGNTFLEMGVHMACALPEVEWLEYSFQNFDHLVDEPVRIADGWAYAPDRPGHGLVLSESARRDWARPHVLATDALGPAPHNPRVAPRN